MTAKEIVKEVVELYAIQRKNAEKEGYYHPMLHGSTPRIKELIYEFERVTGENWDDYAEMISKSNDGKAMNQFISENALIDDLNNYSYFWSICNNKNISVLKGVQYITGISFTNKGFNYSLEGYYKTTNGLNRFIYKDNSSQLKLYHGKGRSYGVDFYIRKIIRNHEFWVTYSLSKTEEKFNNFKKNEFHDAPQDQRHEIKGAALFNFNPFFISINYVYGSGLASSTDFKDLKTEPYNRLDLAFLYKFNVKRIKFESGLSIINLLNTNNVRYNDFSNLPGGKTIYSEAMPFTPTLFLNIGF